MKQLCKVWTVTGCEWLETEDFPLSVLVSLRYSMLQFPVCVCRFDFFSCYGVPG